MFKPSQNQVIQAAFGAHADNNNFKSVVYLFKLAGTNDLVSVG
jgi:hypothetical protein